MKQPKYLKPYPDGTKTKVMELNAHCQDCKRLMFEVDYELSKGTIELIEHTKRRTLIVMEYDKTLKEVQKILNN